MSQFEENQQIEDQEMDQEKIEKFTSEFDRKLVEEGGMFISDLFELLNSL